MATTTSTHKTPRKDKNISSYFSGGVDMTFKSGETIINGFDEPDGVYLIKKGFVKACSTSQDGHANLVLIHSEDEFIPLPWALDGYHVTGLSYVALNDVTVIKSSKDKLRIAMGNNMWLTQEVLNQAINVIAIYTQRIQTLEFRSARGRIIAELLFFSERFGRHVGTGILIDAPITHQDIADSINMNRETASRAIGDLIEEGLIGQTDHLFTIREPFKLREALV
jgi:CRP/FNR family cyclic AMP-dependent transcriptional regulator